MFWRKRQIADAVDADINSGIYTPIETPSMPPVAAPKDDSKPCYQVGVTEEGKVTLRLGTDNNWSQLTMTNEGVSTLIRMLEAAMGDEEIYTDDDPIVKD